ncbi:MAG TPA: DM13 domain-containing protein [Candidatus Limnocylindrales bacterium]|nr:DM13 domain-containing protein [Candidatus Limnocylindrales bacterium]
MEWIGELERAFAAVIYPNRVVIAAVAAVVALLIAALAVRRRWDLVARRHPRRTVAVLVPVLAIALPLGWYLGSPLVLSSTIDEPAPVVAARPSATPSVGPTTTPSDSVAPSAPPSASPAPTPTAELIARAGAFHGADEFHFGRGAARLIETEPGVFVVRLEDFEVRNGPDLYVYLSPERDGYAEGAIELGRLKADTGNQNYAVPAGVDPAEVGSVVIWCKQFSVLFAWARLGA